MLLVRNGQVVEWPSGLDQIQEDLIKEKERGEKMAFAADDDLPGLGQFYCTPCGRHFFDEASLTSHANSRGHVRR